MRGHRGSPSLSTALAIAKTGKMETIGLQKYEIVGRGVITKGITLYIPKGGEYHTTTTPLL